MKMLISNRALQLAVLAAVAGVLFLSGHGVGALGVVAFAGTIEDGLLQFDGAVGSASFAAITVTRDSTNVIDLLNARDIGAGDGAGQVPKLNILVGAAFAAAGAATLTISAQGSVDNITYTEYANSGPLALAQLVANSKLFPIDWPHRAAGAALPRYLKLVYTVATGPMTAGTIHAALVLTRNDATAYPPGVTVSN